MKNYGILAGIGLGLLAETIQNSIGMLSMKPAVDYYEEAHYSKFNCLIHTIFMPFTMYGMFVWIPAAILFPPPWAKAMRQTLCTAYVVHYASIDWKIGLAVFIMYLPSYINAEKHYYDIYKYYDSTKYVFLYGILYSICALFIQEFIGHWISGDIASRPEGVPNAIVYAMYFSVSHLF
jgi:uncharacterized membrane protein YGL010W